ncbi:MAG: hypothetical protein FWG65_12685 [Turicibacter sp.]|nr:hypothetical protein [Turicibacter sp.]
MFDTKNKVIVDEYAITDEDSLFRSIKKGLEQVLAFQRGEPVDATINRYDQDETTGEWKLIETEYRFTDKPPERYRPPDPNVGKFHPSIRQTLPHNH